MARHKKIETEEQGDPEMNISSLIDCCFLLLIYFLVATTLVSEKKIDMATPATESESSDSPPPEVGRIEVKANGIVIYNGLPVGDATDGIDPSSKQYSQYGHLTQLRDSLITLRDQTKAQGAEPLVLLSGSKAAPHQRIIDVMSALSEAGIKAVGLQATTE